MWPFTLFYYTFLYFGLFRFRLYDFIFISHNLMQDLHFLNPNAKRVQYREKFMCLLIGEGIGNCIYTLHNIKKKSFARGSCPPRRLLY